MSPEVRPFVTEGFEVPRRLRSERFSLEPLGPEHNERDYAAWSSSIEHIRATPGFPMSDGWPYPASLEENLRDLEQHADEFADRSAFAFTVLDPVDDRVIGCVYVTPANHADHDAVLRTWVVADRAELDRELRAGVADWLDREWPFTRVELPGTVGGDLAPQVDDGLDALRPLLGTWRGSGAGVWQGGRFAYEEEMTFELGGGGADFPFITFTERAWDESSGETMHSERGMWRVHEDGAIDVTLAHPIGVTEIAEGSAEGGRIRLASVRIQIAERGLPVASLRREYDVEGDELSYRIHLATAEVPLFEHLVGGLRRVR